MDKIKIRFDPTANTLLIWFDDPQQMAYLTPIEEDSPGDLHLIRNEEGAVIGIECQFYHVASGQLRLETEVMPLTRDELAVAASPYSTPNTLQTASRKK